MIAVASCCGAGLLFRARYGLAFTATSLVCLLVPVWVFACLWPDVLPDRGSRALSLTVHDASSSHYTLVVMTVVALIFTPIVLAYQAWTYWVFRARIGVASVGADAYGARPSIGPAQGRRRERGDPGRPGGRPEPLGVS